MLRTSPSVEALATALGVSLIRAAGSSRIQCAAISRIPGLAGALPASVVSVSAGFFISLRACLDCNERIVVIEAGARH